jgi:5'-nucleotidase
MQKPLIFLTNDDGVAAPGLASLIEALRPLGRLIVIAPEDSMSGMSHAITMTRPLYLRKVRQEEGLDVYACSGTPVDCVKMGFDNLLKNEKIALVCSGINHGSNSAISVLYSGTMGAAIEGSFYGLPSIGFSLIDHSEGADFEAAAIYASRIASRILSAELTLPLCLNVNVPLGKPEAIKGIKVCRQTKGYYREEFFCRQDPRGRDYYWLTGDFLNEEPEAVDTDEWALNNGYVSVVPIQVDMTDHAKLRPLTEILGREI